MLVALPLVALALAIALMTVHAGAWRVGILGGAVVWGLTLVALSELASLALLLTTGGLAVGWALSCVALAAGLWLARRHGRTLPPHAEWPARWAPRVLLGLFALVGATLAGIAVWGAPNTWDSMTYHLARLVHWQQGATLAPYPTHVPRQLYLAPGAELVMLQTLLLTGGDHLVSLVQWAAAVGSVVGVSAISASLGGRLNAQLLASAFALSIPIGVLEATSTQNDWVVTFWLVVAALFALRTDRTARGTPAWGPVLLCGASLGLAVATKATAAIFGAPVAIFLGCRCWRLGGWRAAGPLASAAVIALATNAGILGRNWAVFGSPLGPLDEGSPDLRYLNTALSPTLFASNLLRDLALNGVATPLGPVNQATASLVAGVHTLLGVSVVDPRTTWGGHTFGAQAIGLSLDENFASNPVHLLLVLGALGLILGRPRRFTAPTVGYAIVVASGLLLFAAALRWQPWHTRLELPFFVLGAPLVALGVAQVRPRWELPLALGLVLATGPWLVLNQARPLVGPRSILTRPRADQYFTSQPWVREPFEAAVTSLHAADCTQIGLLGTADSWEYPLWALLSAASPGQVRLAHVAVDNPTAVWPPRPAIRPCAIVALGLDAPPERITWLGQTFVATEGGDPTVRVLWPVQG